MDLKPAKNDRLLGVSTLLSSIAKSDSLHSFRTDNPPIAIMTVATISKSRSFQPLFVRLGVWAEDSY